MSGPDRFSDPTFRFFANVLDNPYWDNQLATMDSAVNSVFSSQANQEIAMNNIALCLEGAGRYLAEDVFQISLESEVTDVEAIIALFLLISDKYMPEETSKTDSFEHLLQALKTKLDMEKVREFAKSLRKERETGEETLMDKGTAVALRNRAYELQSDLERMKPFSWRKVGLEGARADLIGVIACIKELQKLFRGHRVAV